MNYQPGLEFKVHPHASKTECCNKSYEVRLAFEVPTPQKPVFIKGDVRQEDLQQQFFAQHYNAMLEQCCNCSKQRRNNVVNMCCAKNSRCESFRVT